MERHGKSHLMRSYRVLVVLVVSTLLHFFLHRLSKPLTRRTKHQAQLVYLLIHTILHAFSEPYSRPGGFKIYLVRDQLYQGTWPSHTAV
jgi:hypothetical protein